MEINYPELTQKLKKEEMLDLERIPLDEARSRLEDETTDTYHLSAENLIRFNVGNEQVTKQEAKQRVKRFETETYRIYQATLQKMLDSDEMHQTLIAGKRLSLVEIKELIVAKRWIDDPQEITNSACRIHLILNRSLDLEILRLQIEDEVNGAQDKKGASTFDEETRGKLIKVMRRDYNLQYMWATALARAGNHLSDAIEVGDIVNVEELVNDWCKKAGIEDPATREGLKGLFYDKETEMLSQLMTKKKISDVRDSLVINNLISTNRIKDSKMPLDQEFTEDFENDCCANLVVGRYGFLKERAQKTEMVRLLIAIENAQDLLMDWKLPKPEKYRVNTSSTSGSSSFDGVTNTITWYTGYLRIDRSGAWVNEDRKTAFWKKSELLTQEDIRTNLKTLEVIELPVWIEAWTFLAHERQHQMYKNDWITRIGEQEYISNQLDYVMNYSGLFELRREESVRLDHWPPGARDLSKVRRTDCALRLYEALNEGMAIMVERDAIKTLLDHSDELEISPENRARVNLIRKSREINHSIYMSHYYVGQRIVQAWYMDGFREKSESKNLSMEEALKQKRTRGIEKVKQMLDALDIEKITTSDSRLRAENEAVDPSMPTVIRKAWQMEKRDIPIVSGQIIWSKEVYERMRALHPNLETETKYVSTEVVVLTERYMGTGTVINLMNSNDPAKRKLGQAKFLEMFGK